MLNHNRVWESTFNRAYYFGRSLVKRGHEVTIVTNSKHQIWLFKEFLSEGVKIIETPDLLWGRLRTGWDLVNALRRKYYLRVMQFDVIHALDCRPTVIIPALYLKKTLKIPLVIDWADWWGRGGAINIRKPIWLNRCFEPIETFFEEKFRHKADYTTVISPLLGERAINLGIPEDKICFIPHGSDTESIYPIDKQYAREQLGLLTKNYILIFSGFVLYDTAILAKAFELVQQKFPDILLFLTGQKNILRNHCKKDELGCKILNIGFVPKNKFVLYLAAADLCLMPLADNLANQARFPGRIGDYMAAGRPIISNPVGEAGKIVKENNLGLLSQPNGESFANAIIEGLEDEKSRIRWGQNAREVAENKYSFDILCQKFEDVYKKVLN